MWRTCEGERVLQGAEWELFAAGLAGLWELVEEALLAGQPVKTGLAVFDELQPTQQLALLALVAQALHDETVASPPLTAHNEGAVAAVFAHIGDRLEDEIDRQVSEPAEMSVAWRQRVLAASQEHEPDQEEPLPDRRNTNPEEWDLLMDCLETRIFWDSDYAMGDAFLDDAPDKSQQLMSEMGIADDYFIAVAPDPTDKELDAVRQILRQLTGR